MNTLKTMLLLAFTLALAALAGCIRDEGCDGGSDCPSPLFCDSARDVCVECLSDSQCRSDEVCDRGWCEFDSGPPIDDPCGDFGEACCGGSACDAGLFCSRGTCIWEPEETCGGEGDECCSGSTCDGSLECVSDSCRRPASTCSRGIDQSCSSDAECCSDPTSGAPGYCTGLDGIFTCRAGCTANSQCASGCCTTRTDGVGVCSPPSLCSSGYPSGYRLFSCGCWGYTDGRDAPDPRCASGWVRFSFECAGTCSGGGFPYAVYCR